MTKAERLQIECARLNAEIPIGTFVSYWPVSGPYFYEHRRVVTQTTSEFTIHGNRVVVWLASGGFVCATHIETDATRLDEKAHHKWITKFSRP